MSLLDEYTWSSLHKSESLKDGKFFEPKYEDEGAMKGKEHWGEGDKTEVVGEALDWFPA